MADFVEGSTRSKIRVKCYYKNGTVFDLTGKTIDLLFRCGDGAQQRKAMTILSPATAGEAEYQFATGELVAGKMVCEVEVNTGGGILPSANIGVFSVRGRV